MILNTNVFIKIFILVFVIFYNTFGQNTFEFDEQRSSILQDIISSDIGIADLNSDGVNDLHSIKGEENE